MGYSKTIKNALITETTQYLQSVTLIYLISINYYVLAIVLCQMQYDRYFTNLQS